ncbi:MAG: 16S rRNA (cytosine(1402)-N(4))-methyltransferase RsmH [Candidatus Moraniibacteriota bacterium]
MHKTVLLEEAVNGLNLKRESVVVDATVGGGGHSLKILDNLDKKGILIGIDIDKKALEEFQDLIKERKYFSEIILKSENFSNLDKVLQEENIDGVDGILADLGWRSQQIEDKNYGFSFKEDVPLDMRLGKKEGLDAKEIVNNWKAEDLERIFKEFGEERYARKVAMAIEKSRENEKIETTGQLVDIIEKSIGGYYRKLKIHSATRVFQAIRIEVNKELENLETFLEKSLKVLNPGGRMVIISFHSLEDRMVKRFFRTNARGCICPKDLPVCACGEKPLIKIINKKPLTPSEEEIANNSRSRSAKLRIAEKI